MGRSRLVVQRLVNEDEAWRTVARRLEIRYAGMEDDRAKGITLQSLDPRRLLRSRYFPRLPRPSISIPTIRPRQVAAFLALVAVALAAVAGVWTLATRQVSAGAATPATAAPFRPRATRRHTRNTAAGRPRPPAPDARKTRPGESASFGLYSGLHLEAP